MKTYLPVYEQFNNSASKNLRLVIKINWSTPVYIASHSDIPNIPAGTLQGMLSNCSSVSQRLQPDQGRSTIGKLSFSVIDVAGAFTTEVRTRQAAGEGINEKIVELYRAGAGMDWSDFQVEQTQQVDDSVRQRNGEYHIQCSDIQRAMRKDLYDVAKTTLSADFLAGETTTLNVFDTSAFEACTHVASFGDQQTGSHYYLKIKYSNGFEIIRATGKTATTFTGLERGKFGTDDVTHVFPTGTDDDSSVEIEEYVYLELPVPQLIRALLTGTYEGGTIPARWSLGIDPLYVDTASFDDIGEDWFDGSDYSKGLIFRFQGVTKTDGKRFIEQECCLLAGAFLIVRANGKLALRRMTGIISSADYVAELDSSNIVDHGALTYDLSRIVNIFDIRWSWLQLPGENQARYFRRNILPDATSIAIHGQQKPLELSFKGLHNERHTYTTLRNRFDAVRDRYAGPPAELPVELLPSYNVLEVGDIVRTKLDTLRDYTAAGTLDRSFEIERIVVDQVSGSVKADLFGSTQKAEPIVDDGAGVNAELPDGWYSSVGTEMVAAGLTIDGAGIMTANGTLAGGTTTRTVFYYLGDFTIQAGVTLTLTGNVELRIRGQFQNNGDIVVGGGRSSNTAGFIGTTIGGPGIFLGNGSGPFPRNGQTVVFGDHSALPLLEIENDAGTLVGIPEDMRGSGGGLGGDVFTFVGGSWLSQASGGSGGAGGGSLVTVSRGFGYGVSGEVDLSGGGGGVGGTHITTGAGSGGGGAPGALLHLLDGSGVTFPILVGNVVAGYGTSPITNGEDRTQGKAKASDPVDLGISNARVAFVPKSREPYPDYVEPTGGAGAGDMVADPTIIDSTSWDLISGSSYVVAGGVDDTDAIHVQLDSASTGFRTKARRGPIDFDVTASGQFSIEMRWRTKLHVAAGGGSGMNLQPTVYISDLDGSNGSTYFGRGVVSFDDTDPTGVWFDDTAVVQITDTGTPPRYIQIGFTGDINLLGPVLAIDSVRATTAGTRFAGAEKSGNILAPAVEVGKTLHDSGDFDWKYKVLAKETAAGLTVVDGDLPVGNARRYSGVDPTGATESTATLNKIAEAGGLLLHIDKDKDGNGSYLWDTPTLWASGTHLWCDPGVTVMVPSGGGATNLGAHRFVNVRDCLINLNGSTWGYTTKPTADEFRHVFDFRGAINCRLNNGYAINSGGDGIYIGAGVAGSHDGLANAASLKDTSRAWPVNGLVGQVLLNTTDGSSTIVTSNTADEIFGTLTGGVDNDWDVSDGYLLQPYCDGVVVDNMVCDNNRRQGLSLVSGKRCRVLNSVFKNTAGTAPECGIDVEPDSNDHVIEDCILQGITTIKNAGEGIRLDLRRLPGTKPQHLGLIIDGHSSYFDDVGQAVSKLDVGSNVFTGQFLVKGFNSNQSWTAGIAIQNYDANGPRIVYDRPHISNPNRADSSSVDFGAAIRLTKQVGDTGATVMGNIWIHAAEIHLNTSNTNIHGYYYAKDNVDGALANIHITGPWIGTGQTDADKMVDFEAAGTFEDPNEITKKDYASGSPIAVSWTNYGKIKTNAGSGGNIELDLGQATTIPDGMPSMIFRVVAAQTLILDPPAASHIYPGSNGVGKNLSSNDVGAEVELVMRGGHLYKIRETGTWTPQP